MWFHGTRVNLVAFTTIKKSTPIFTKLTTAKERYGLIRTPDCHNWEKKKMMLRRDKFIYVSSKMWLSRHRFSRDSINLGEHLCCAVFSSRSNENVENRAKIHLRQKK